MPEASRRVGSFPPIAATVIVATLLNDGRKEACG